MRRHLLRCVFLVLRPYSLPRACICILRFPLRSVQHLFLSSRATLLFRRKFLSGKSYHLYLLGTSRQCFGHMSKLRVRLVLVLLLYNQLLLRWRSFQIMGHRLESREALLGAHLVCILFRVHLARLFHK